MKKILLDYRAATVKPNSGVARQIYALEAYLQARSDVDLLLVSDGPLDHVDRERMIMPAKGVGLDQVPRPFRRLWYEQVFLRRIIKEQKPDIFYGAINSGLPIFGSSQTTYIQWVHDLFHITEKDAFPSFVAKLRYLPYYWFSFYTSMRLADKVHVISNYTCHECVRLFPFVKDKIIKIYNYVEQPTEFEKADVAGLPDNYWLIVSSNESRKNLPRFLTQWAGLDDDERLPLVLVGEESPFLREMQAQPDFYFYSKVSDSELNTLYMSASCLWQPSLAEGFGLPVIEALVRGTPIAVARGSALDEITPQGMPNFDGRSEEDIRRCMRQLALKPPARPQKDKVSQWVTQFDYAAFSRQLDELLNPLLMLAD